MTGCAHDRPSAQKQGLATTPPHGPPIGDTHVLAPPPLPMVVGPMPASGSAVQIPPAWPTDRPVFGTHASAPAHAHGLSPGPPHGPPAFETQGPGPLPATPLSTGPLGFVAGHALASSAAQIGRHIGNSRITHHENAHCCELGQLRMRAIYHPTAST
jgi:hypothetical protein